MSHSPEDHTLRNPPPGMIKVPPEIYNRCTWESDEDGIWYASCDKTQENPFCFEDSGPARNGFKFCPFCARPLVEVKPAE